VEAKLNIGSASEAHHGLSMEEIIRKNYHFIEKNADTTNAIAVAENT